jgi:hypothetical protein
MDIGHCKYFNRFELQFKCTGEGVGSGTFVCDTVQTVRNLHAVMFVRTEELRAAFHANMTGVVQFHLFCTARVLHRAILSRLHSGFGRVHLLI